MFYLLVFLLGLCVGSFLNVVAFRYGSGKRIVFSRSKCMECGKTLSWFELVPLLSFLIQGGRCRNCGSKLSWQYPLVELLTGFTFVLVLSKTQLLSNITLENFLASLLQTLFFLVIFSILLVIAVYDFRHKIIPDGLVFLFIGLSFAKALFGYFLGSETLAEVITSGLFIAFPFFALWFISRGRWMGFGDVKLALGMGFLLGLARGLYAVLWSFWLGGLVSIILLLAQSIFSGKALLFTSLGQRAESGSETSLFSEPRRFTMKSEVPFGPFMILGTAISFFLNWDFFNLLV
ncbi:MAG: leader peptidase (prepilin peptidase) / N-methyltransferase [Parcubacteria group bacterium Gr01-1014_107]|nr:MAG: leader peptidase (prepilin peptidase) / N-methyltransferase [Parcubacteria group bacterium Gr01-1014_107]